MRLAILISVVAHLIALTTIYAGYNRSTKGDRLDVRGLSEIIKRYDPYSPLPESDNIEDRREGHDI